MIVFIVKFDIDKKIISVLIIKKKLKLKFSGFFLVKYIVSLTL